ncbi:hypothetical protein [Sphingopyxis macrogoltabida]|uniref:Uncharacterized protein n=1 Tax=Sphingopyxis macrogoltabida TaxID=33050 RepID=A0A0N9UU13_SPHMC|nr:hypothetical protein [Sphingopyxis macrogoltabida]ALH80269.1 hypothetical protein AN936_07765 [Sphingopyxis macrogoltabida]
MRRRDTLYANRPKSIYIFEWLIWALPLTLFVDVLLAFTALAMIDPAIMYIMNGALRTVVPVVGGLLSFAITFLFSEYIAHRASDIAKRLYTFVAGSGALASYIMIWRIRPPHMPDSIAIAGFVAASVTVISILTLFRRDASTWLKRGDAETFR